MLTRYAPGLAFALAAACTATACGSDVQIDDAGATFNMASATGGGSVATGSVGQGAGEGTGAAAGVGGDGGAAGATGGEGAGGAGGSCSSTNVQCNDASECCPGWICAGDPPSPQKKGRCCIEAFANPVCTTSADCCFGACLSGLCWFDA